MSLSNIKNKKIIFLSNFFIIILLFFFVFKSNYIIAYNPTIDDQNYVKQLKNQLNGYIGGNNEDLWHYFFQLKMLHSEFLFESRISYLINQLKSDLWNQINIKKMSTKLQSKKIKEDFVNTYIGGINKTVIMPDNCIGRYNTIDDVSFTHDFPTALVIAYWYRESTCGYFLPKNGQGPFQIITKNYGTGQITEEVFIQSIIDFINFSKQKIDRYQKSNSKSGLLIDISYDNFSFTGVVRHGALYNSLSGNTVYGEILPKYPGYVFDNYGNGFESFTKNGILAQFLTILKRELDNKH